MTMKSSRRIAVWVAATKEKMASIQEDLYNDWESPISLPACAVEEDRNKTSKELDDEAFLQLYIEGVADVLCEKILDQKDKSHHAPCQPIAWPSLWMTKLVYNADNVSDAFSADNLIKEYPYGIHGIDVTSTQFAYQATTQVCVPISVGAIQAGLAYLKLSVPHDCKEITNELYLTKEEAYRILEFFREHQKHMLSNILTIPRLSVISPHAIHC